MIVHVYILFLIKQLIECFLLHGTEKLCSKFGEYRSINHDTVLSMNADGLRTLNASSKVILYSVQCCALCPLLGQTIDMQTIH